MLHSTLRFSKPTPRLTTSLCDRHSSIIISLYRSENKRDFKKLPTIIGTARIWPCPITRNSNSKSDCNGRISHKSNRNESIAAFSKMLCIGRWLILQHQLIENVPAQQLPLLEESEYQSLSMSPAILTTPRHCPCYGGSTQWKQRGFHPDQWEAQIS